MRVAIVTSYAGASVVRTPSVPLPGYRDFRLGRPWPLLASTLRAFSPDVVHLASPAALGAQGGAPADSASRSSRRRCG